MTIENEVLFDWWSQCRSMVSNETILAYEEDRRKPLDSDRERAFHRGWNDALDSGPYNRGTYNRPIWQDLGNRM